MRPILITVALLLAMASRAGAASFDTTPTPTTTTTTTTTVENPTLTLVSPKLGAIVIGKTVKVVVRITGMTPVRVTVNNGLNLRPGATQTWSAVYRLADQAGRQAFTVDAGDQAGRGISARGWVRRYDGRTITPRPDLMTTLGILGCSPCIGQDKRGDALQNGPDITRVTAAARNALVTVTITTANSWSGGTVCAFFHVSLQGREEGGSLDCYGNKINNGGLDGDLPIPAPRHPNAHTTIISFQVALLRRAPYLIKNPRFICIGVWAHGSADFAYDEFPNKTLGLGPMFKLQLRPDA